MIMRSKWTLLFFFLATAHSLWDLISGPGIEPLPLAVKVQSPNHWAAMEFPGYWFFLSDTAEATMTDTMGPTHLSFELFD